MTGRPKMLPPLRGDLAISAMETVTPIYRPFRTHPAVSWWRDQVARMEEEMRAGAPKSLEA